MWSWGWSRPLLQMHLAWMPIGWNLGSTVDRTGSTWHAALVQCLLHGWWSAECQARHWSRMRPGAVITMPGLRVLIRPCTSRSWPQSMLIGLSAWKQLRKRRRVREFQRSLWSRIRRTCTWSRRLRCSARRRWSWLAKLWLFRPMMRRTRSSQQCFLRSLGVQQSNQWGWSTPRWELWPGQHDRMRLLWSQWWRNRYLWQSRGWLQHRLTYRSALWRHPGDLWSRDDRRPWISRPWHLQRSWIVWGACGQHPAQRLRARQLNQSCWSQSRSVGSALSWQEALRADLQKVVLSREFQGRSSHQTFQAEDDGIPGRALFLFLFSII